MAVKKTLQKQKKKYFSIRQKNKSKEDSGLVRLISKATSQAFNNKRNLKNKKITTKRGFVQKYKRTKYRKKRSPSASTNSCSCSEQTLSYAKIDESLSPSISSRDSKNETTNNKNKNKNECPSESQSSKYIDSEIDSNEFNKDEVLSLNVGSTFKNGKYKVERKLGYGAFSTVWLAWDQQDNKYVALKIQNCSKDCIKAAQEEIKIHKKIVADKAIDEKAIVKLLDHFEHKTSHNRKHVCMVFEYLGDNLLTLIKANKYKGLPLPIVKNLAKQILTGLNYLHKDLKIIHTDLKPENILLTSPSYPYNDPYRLSFGGTTIATKRSFFSTPTPSKTQPNLNLFHIKNLGGMSYERDSQGENLSQPSSKVGSRPTTPTHNQRIRNALNNADANSKMEVEEGQVTSEPESFDRLAIDSDPDIARNLDLHNKAKGMLESGGNHQVKFATPRAGQNLKSNDPLNPSVTYDIKCKIVDLGTACRANKILIDDIQTRPYRCPEVLLGCKYSTSADMWSFGCLVFELATGSVLFDPQTGGSEYNRDEDHLAQIVEVLGPIPKKLIAKGTHSYNYLTKEGELKRRKPRGYCPLDKILVSEYRFSERDAKELAEFLFPILELIPNKRPSAAECLHHPWLKN